MFKTEMTVIFYVFMITFGMFVFMSCVCLIPLAIDASLTAVIFCVIGIVGGSSVTAQNAVFARKMELKRQENERIRRFIETLNKTLNKNSKSDVKSNVE